MASPTTTIDFWNGPAAERWVRFAPELDFSLEALGVAAMDAAPVREGDRVLDVGCGTGATTLELARRVGARGRVLGLDVSGPMLAGARDRLAGHAQVSFELGDASVAPIPEAAFDVLFSRFGVMFFGDTGAAFAHLARALRPGGRVSFVCWRTMPENEWAKLPFDVASAFLPPAPPEPPDAPGPFALADAARVRAALEGAGLRDVVLAPLDAQMPLGRGTDLASAAQYTMQSGVIARRLVEADDATRAKVEAAVSAALAPRLTPSGIRLGAACWLVTATR